MRFLERYLTEQVQLMGTIQVVSRIRMRINPDQRITISQRWGCVSINNFLWLENGTTNR